MIDIVIPCSVPNTNKIQLLTLGLVDLPWSPNWTTILNTNNKVLVYDIVTDNTLNDANIMINVGHTTIKLNDFKFLFKMNGFHSNVKLYYDMAIVIKLIKYSIPLNTFMMLYEDLVKYNLTEIINADPNNIDLTPYINKLTNENQGLLNFTKRYIDLIKNDNRIDVIEDTRNTDEGVISKHSKLIAYLSKQHNNVKEASHLAINKLIDLLQLDRKAYEGLRGKPIPAGSASFSPQLPNVTRAQLFRISGETEEQTVQGYSSGVLFYECISPITLSFLIYQENDKMQITANAVAFRPKLVGSKDPKLYNDITNDASAYSDLMNKFSNEKIFEEISLNFDLLNKACKALMNNDLIYYFAITKCYIDLVQEQEGKK